MKRTLYTMAGAVAAIALGFGGAQLFAAAPQQSASDRYSVDLDWVFTELMLTAVDHEQGKVYIYKLPKDDEKQSNCTLLGEFKLNDIGKQKLPIKAYQPIDEADDEADDS